MPFFPEQLYALGAKDLQVTWLDPFIRTLITSQAAATVVSDIVVPNDRSLLLQHVFGKYGPGAGQNVNLIRLSILEPLLSFELKLKEDDTNFAANFVATHDWQGSLLIPSSWVLRAQAVFNAGVAANSSELNVAGLVIPNANVARV